MCFFLQYFNHIFYHKSNSLFDYISIYYSSKEWIKTLQFFFFFFFFFFLKYSDMTSMTLRTVFFHAVFLTIFLTVFTAVFSHQHMDSVSNITIARGGTVYNTGSTAHNRLFWYCVEAPDCL